MAKNKPEMVEKVAPELTFVELQQEIFNIKFKYDSLINFIKPMMSHEMLVAFGDKKKEIFG